MLLFLSANILKLKSLGNYLFKFDKMPDDWDDNTKNRLVRKWLKQKKIDTHCINGHDYVYKILVDFELQKEICRNLQKTNPENWKAIFLSGTNDEELIAMILTYFENDTEMMKEEMNLSISKPSYKPKHFKL